jgi:hypothetical protein
MLAPTQKLAPTTLVHHPSTVLDDLCAYTLANSAWSQFDGQISQQLAKFEEQNRKHWTPVAVRKSLGR